MDKDPIVEEVRAVRRDIERQQPDADSFYEQLRRQQETHRDRLVQPEPQRMPQKDACSA